MISWRGKVFLIHQVRIQSHLLGEVKLAEVVRIKVFNFQSLFFLGHDSEFKTFNTTIGREQGDALHFGKATLNQGDS
jgi:hypothetical protein